MKPIKNVFAACDGSKKGYSVNGSEVKCWSDKNETKTRLQLRPPF